jgi:hypothetical protein
MPTPTPPEVAPGQLERLVERALERGSPVLGDGEIALVRGWPPDAPAFARRQLLLVAAVVPSLGGAEDRERLKASRLSFPANVRAPLSASRGWPPTAAVLRDRRQVEAVRLADTERLAAANGL